MPEEASAPAPTARRILVDWANGEDNWVRAIASELFATRRPLSNEALARVFQMFLAEKGLRGDSAPPVAPLGLEGGDGESLEALRLSALTDVGGVNALAANQEIHFNPRLTVLFGENATGKTGYVRILKRLAAVRSAEPVLPNVVGPRAAARPHALVAYARGETQDTLEWNDETGVPPFTRVSVFDAMAVSLHVDEDLTFAYTPGDLALFRLTHQAIETVRTQLETARNNAQPRANPFLPKFSRDTAVYLKIETLGPSTDVGELESLAKLTEEEAGQVDALREKVEALRPQALQSRLQLARGDRELYSSGQTALRTIRSFDWSAYNGGVVRLHTAAERYRAATEETFVGEDIPGGLADTWQAFIHAGEEYIRELGRADYPQHGDKCLYCRQELPASAVRLVRKYRDYSSDAFKKELTEAQEELNSSVRPLTSLNLDDLRTAFERKRASFENAAEVPEVITQVIITLQTLAPLIDAVRKREPVDPNECLRSAEATEALAKAAFSAAQSLISTLTSQAEERERAFAEESSKLRNLEARLILRAVLAEVKLHVEQARWASRATTILTQRFPPLMRSLTEASKRASDVLLNQDFERRFEKECEALRAPRVSLDFPGRRGEPARRKTLSPDHRLSEVLSEGEQKMLALADFLAETSLQQTPAPVVFDDPVTSLDYKGLRHVVDRIVRLSEQRQVIVFTHNIWFAAELLARFESTRENCTFYGVTASEHGAGVVSHGAHPRWDTVSNLRGRVNGLIQDASTAAGEAQSALIEKAYDLMRAWSEVVVEQEILCGVAQRYQPHVAMTKLPRIKADRLPEVVSVIHPLYEKACRIMGGHSQPLETLAVRPTLAELREDWTILQEARERYIRDGGVAA